MLDAWISLLRGRRLAVLTGAGISTESGIPDYRGPETRRRARNPIRFQVFAKDEAARARYWARSFVGWPRFSAARPNPAHQAIARLQRAGMSSGVITQNVDRLHRVAGSDEEIELHGALAEVRCTECGEREAREDLQERMANANPTFHPEHIPLAPDGDADLESAPDFIAPSCVNCGGVLRPDVVFFGETVLPSLVQRAYGRVENAEALLVVGTSLAVFSGYRFVRRAFDRSIPIALLNLGESRGDPYATLRLDAKAGDVLPELAERLLL